LPAPIVAHARLKGTAPAAADLAALGVRQQARQQRWTSFNILKALDWSVRRGARIINMSFRPARAIRAVLRSLAVAPCSGIILVAAAATPFRNRRRSIRPPIRRDRGHGDG